MKALIVLFFAGLLLAQLGGFSVSPGIVVYAHDIFLLLLIIITLPGIVRNKKVRHANLVTPIAAFIFASIVSLLVNYWRFPVQNLLEGSLYLVRWIMYVVLYFIVLTSSDTALWLNGLYAMGCGFAVLGLIQFVLYPYLRNLYYLGWDPHYYRVFSTLFDPNYTGIMLVLTLLLGFDLWKKQKLHLYLITGQIVTFTALLLTYSRSSYVALAVSVIFWAVWTKHWKIILAIAGFIVLVFVFPHVPGSPVRIFRTESALARIGNWQESIQLIAKAPVFGYGFDTLRYLQGRNSDPSGIVSRSASGLDSSLLFIMATTGIVGFAVYIYLLISMIRAGKKSVFYVTSIAAVLVHSLFVNSMFYAWVMIWIWIITGIVESKNYL